MISLLMANHVRRMGQRTVTINPKGIILFLLSHTRFAVSREYVKETAVSHRTLEKLKI